MAAVRDVLAQGGFANVRTWIQSGNIAFSTNLSAKQTAARVRELIHTELGPDLSVIVKTPSELQSVLDGNPFADDAHAINRVFFVLANQAPDPHTARELMAQSFGEDKLFITPKATYLYIPGSAARSRLNTAFLEKKLGLAMTSRNFNTVSKMIGF